MVIEAVDEVGLTRGTEEGKTAAGGVDNETESDTRVEERSGPE